MDKLIYKIAEYTTAKTKANIELEIVGRVGNYYEQTPTFYQMDEFEELIPSPGVNYITHNISITAKNKVENWDILKTNVIDPEINLFIEKINKLPKTEYYVFDLPIPDERLVSVSTIVNMSTRAIVQYNMAKCRTEVQLGILLFEKIPYSQFLSTL